MHATSGIGCRGVRNAANLEYNCNQVWIGSIKKLKGSDRLLQNMVSLEQQRFEWRRADKS